MTFSNFNGQNSFTVNGKGYTNRAASGNTPIYDISSGGGTGGSTYYGGSTSDVVLSQETTLQGNLNNGLGLYTYGKLTVPGGIRLNINGDYAILMASQEIVINGVVRMLRTEGYLDDGVAAGVETIRTSSRSAKPPLHKNRKTMAISTGGGGAGGSGNSLCDGGYNGDDAYHPNGNKILNGGQGGQGGANSSGSNGQNSDQMTAALRSSIQTYVNDNFSFNVGSGGGLTSNLFYNDYYAVDYAGLVDQTLEIPILIGGNGGPGGFGDTAAGLGALGGGNIILIAPKITLGSNTRIEAKGRDAVQQPRQTFMGGTGGGGGGGAVTLVAPTIINQGILTINEKLKVEGGAGIATGAGWSGHVKSGNGGSGVQIIIN
jgi:hypothetical protein